MPGLGCAAPGMTTKSVLMCGDCKLSPVTGYNLCLAKDVAVLIGEHHDQGLPPAARRQSDAAIWWASHHDAAALIPFGQGAGRLFRRRALRYRHLQSPGRAIRPTPDSG